MGIPSYFNYILKNHPGILINKKHVCCDFLFIDANSLIYDSVHDLNSIVSSFEQVYELVFDKLEALRTLLNPTLKMMICFDGVPPLAKMQQQRQRRFKSNMTRHIMDQLQSQENKLKWNTNQITPGTDFMNGLDDFLERRYKNNTKIIFSGSKQCGEGEHKICEYIRTHCISNYQNKTKMIYGLDADLIMLGLLMSMDISNVYLYKETKYFGYIPQVVEDQLYYFNMNKLGLQIDNILGNCVIKQSICDYIFICFLCGNDFMPHLASINIRNNGIEFLLKNYKFLNKAKRKPLIDVSKMTINWKHVNLYINQLANYEKDKICENIQWKSKFKFKMHPTTNEEKLNSLPCFDMVREERFMESLTLYNSVMLNCNNEEDVRRNCNLYLKMLEWTWYYYNGVLISNSFSYEQPIGPLLSDLVKQIPISNEETIHNVNLNSLRKQGQSIFLDAISPITQLYYVLPFEDHQSIVPQDYYNKTSSLIYDHNPVLRNTNFNVDYTFCKFFWEGHLCLDHIDIGNIDSIVKQ